MNEETLQKLIKNIHEMLDLHDKQKELYFHLIEAITVKCYKESHPEANHVNLVSYYKKTGDTWDKYRTYEALPTSDSRFNRINARTLWGNTSLKIGETLYKDITVKGYDLTKFCTEKTIATAVKCL